MLQSREKLQSRIVIIPNAVGEAQGTLQFDSVRTIEANSDHRSFTDQAAVPIAELEAAGSVQIF